jgi:hypothetical protein
MHSQSAEAGRLNIWNRLFAKEYSRPLQRMVEEAQFVTMVREPLSYKIVLAKTLVYKRDERVKKKIEIVATNENRVIDPTIPSIVKQKEIPFSVLVADLEPVSNERDQDERLR